MAIVPRVALFLLFLSACGNDPPPPKPEPGRFGEECDGNDPESCAYGFVCAGLSKCDQGVCLPLCSDDRDCEPIEGVRVYCGLWTSSVKACLHQCEYVGVGTCPDQFELPLACEDLVVCTVSNSLCE